MVSKIKQRNLHKRIRESLKPMLNDAVFQATFLAIYVLKKDVKKVKAGVTLLNPILGAIGNTQEHWEY